MDVYRRHTCDSPSSQVLLTVAVSVAAGFLLCDVAYGSNAIISADTTWSSGTYTYDDVIVQSGATLTCQGVVHILATNVTIASGAVVTADGQGYGTGTGPGGSTSYGDGGSYGGRGSGASAPTYGSATQPVDMGSASGGAYGGWSAGGGAIRIDASGSVILDGRISSNGMSGGGNNGGGAGGSVWVTTTNLAGSGFITANGNQGGSAAGGGGRIAVYYDNASAYTGFADCTAAAGGGGAEPGTTGFFDTSVPNIHMRVFKKMAFGAGSSLHYGAVTFGPSSTLILGGGSSLDVDGHLVLQSGVSATLQGTIQLAAQNLTIGTGVVISADGQGYGTGGGPGGSASYSAGGSYGGRGSGTSALTYGSSTQPTDLGSAGGGAYGGWSAGGGAIRIEVDGTLTLNGLITCNGMSGGGNNGGASGGSVWITTNTLSGVGYVTAKGNQGGSAAGGGGRIALYYKTAGAYTGFANCTAAGGGTGAEAGTVALVDETNNRLNVFTTMAFAPDSSLTFNSVNMRDNAVLALGEGAELQVANAFILGSGGLLTLGGGTTLDVGGTLTVSSNATITVQGRNTSGQILGQWAGEGGTIIAGNAVIGSGSLISADGQGYGTGQGPGGPVAGSWDYSAGGSHGGRGPGNSGPTYDDAMAPTELGSAGGAYYGGWSCGGGAVRLEVDGTLTLDGEISADGRSAGGNNAGGAGGAVWVATDTLAGDGYITATGNQGQAVPGGGGRIAVYYSDASGYTGFANCTAAGGGATAETGTVSFFDTSLTNNHMWIFENMVFGEDSALHFGKVSLAEGGSLVLGGGTTLWVDKALTVGNGAKLSVRGKNRSAQVDGLWQGRGGVIIAEGMTVETGGVISVDGQGYGTSCGPGGAANYAAGGSHGGLGSGESRSTYDDRLQPTDFGSGGGGAYGGWSTGGGAIRIDLSGTLLLNGLISANGLSAGGNNSGGAGGAVWINARSVSGSGAVAANGNQGGSASGGGGRIAVYFQSYEFTGALEADGPGSATDGTVYLCRQSDIVLGQSIEMEAEPFAGHVFRLVSAGTAPGVVLVRLIPLVGDGEWRLLGRYGSAPSESAYGWSGVGETLDTPPAYEMLVTTTAPGNYYFAVLYHLYQKVSPRFRIECEEAPAHYVASLGLGLGSNSGTTTIELMGVGFDANTRIRLRDHTGAILGTFAPLDTSMTGLAATLNLRGLSPQVVDVVVRWGDGHEEILEEAFEITGGQAGRLVGRVDIPNPVRALRPRTFWIEFANDGGSDIPAPLLVVKSLQNLAMRLSPVDPFERRNMLILALREINPVAVLPAGTRLQVPVQFVPEGGPHEILNFKVEQLTENGTALSWGSIKDQSKPDATDSQAWDIIWQRFTSQVGGSSVAFCERLRDDAQYLADRGRFTRDATRLLELELSAAGAGTGVREPIITEVDAYTGTEPLGLAFMRVAVDTIDARFTLGALGWGWSHSYEYRVVFNDAETAEIVGPGGFVRRYTKEPGGPWRGAACDLGLFQEVTGGWRLIDKGALTWFFDVSGRLTSLSDPNGNTITLVYTGELLSEIRHSNGQEFTLEYNGSGRLAKLYDHASRPTVYAYSGELLTQVTHPGSAVTTYTYESTGSARFALKSIRRPDGTYHHFTHDTLGRLSAESLTNGPSRSYAYPALGVVETTNALGSVSRREFDFADLLLRAETPMGRNVDFAFTDHDRVMRCGLPDGASVNRLFDSAGYPYVLLDAGGTETWSSFTSDFGRLDWLRDAGGYVTDFAYDARGNLVKAQFCDGSKMLVSPNGMGLATNMTNRRGQRTDYTRDSQGRITQKRIGAAMTSIAYDIVGRPVSITDAAGAIGFTYNALDLINSMSLTDGRSFSYQYDTAGKRTLRTGNDGFAVQYSYDSTGRLYEIRTGSGALLIRYEYDDAGMIWRESRGNGTYTIYEYDDDCQVTRVTHYNPSAGVQAQFVYEYNAAGQCVAVTDAEGRTEFVYDAVGRLTLAEYPGGDSESFIYDVRGNRTQTTNGGGTTAYFSDGMNRYTVVGGQILRYDADGNLTAQNGSTYQYDAENRLTNLANPGVGTWAYSYNGLGHRIAVNRDGVTTSYVYDRYRTPELAAEYNASGNLVARYIHGFAPVARVAANGSVAYFGFDGLGNTRIVTGTGGAVLNTYAYAAFGAERTVSETVTVPFRFCGAFGVIHEETGLLSIGARHYDPALGRFLSPDPAGLLGGLHPYAYAFNDPVNCVDSSGFAGQSKKQNFWEWFETLWKIPDKEVEERAKGTSWDSDMWVDPRSARELKPDEVQEINKGAKETAVETIGTLVTPGGGGSKLIKTVSKPAEKEARKSLKQKWNEWWKSRGKKLTGNTSKQLTNCLGMLFQTTASGNSEVVTPNDPNEKAGPAGYGAQHAVRTSDCLTYTIFFENRPTASAPAQEVVITDQLDPDLDPSTLMLSEIAWGDVVLAVPGEVQAFAGRQAITDYRAGVSASWFVDVSSGLDAGGCLTWRLRTIDPLTEKLPEDALAGFLPPNDDTHRGEGHVTFCIKTKGNVAEGTKLTNTASIVFDTESPIETNEVSNVIQSFHRGDIDLSSAVNAVDVQLVINAALGIESAPYLYNCDIDCDGKTNAVDVQLVINAALGLD